MSQSAIVFLLDSKYLPPFEVFLHSLHETESLADIPIVVMTTDETLLGDRLIQRVAHDVVLIDQAERERYLIVKKEEDGAGEARFHFFKFHVFTETRFDQILYFDVDLMAFSNLDGLLSARGSLAMLGSRTLGSSQFKMPDGSKKSFEERLAVSEQFLSVGATATDRPRIKTGLNSGVMVIGREMLGIGTRNALLSIAAGEAFEGDQNVIANYLHTNADVSFGYLPNTFNVPRRAFDNTGAEFFTNKRKDLNILHFNGGHPWKKPGATNFIDYVWWDAYERSRPFINGLRS
jgi:lipopolysaccharide biosynthesis glycosyltransferase